MAQSGFSFLSRLLLTALILGGVSTAFRIDGMSPGVSGGCGLVRWTGLRKTVSPIKKIPSGSAGGIQSILESSKPGKEKIVALYNKAFLLKSDGTVWGWGDCIGPTPVLLPELSGVMNIEDARDQDECGYLFLKKDGTIHLKQNGVESQIGGLPPIASIHSSADYYYFSNHLAFTFYAVADDGTLWAWGNGSLAQFGDGTGNDRVTPSRMTGFEAVADVSVSVDRSYAVMSDGTVWGWGINGFKILGDGSAEHRLTPVRIWMLDHAVSIRTGLSSAAALRNDGTVSAWDTHHHPFPMALGELTGVSEISLEPFGEYLLALQSDGTVWERNISGELRQVPLDFTSPVRSIAAGPNYGLALLEDGNVLSWSLKQSCWYVDAPVLGRPTATDCDPIPAYVTFPKPVGSPTPTLPKAGAGFEAGRSS